MHNYTLVVNGSVGKLYVDGELVSETADLFTTPADMGSSQLCYLGKSFYPDDVNFKGSIDNLKIFKAALTENEVKSVIGKAASENIDGDVNGDNKVDGGDLTALRNYLLAEKSDIIAYNADLDHNNVIDVFDLIQLRKTISALPR